MTQKAEVQTPAKATRSHKPAPPTATPVNAAKAAKSKTPAKATSQAPAEPVGPRGKIGLVVTMLKRPQGASVSDMMEATGWQAHSVRGALAGAIKKKLALKVGSTKTDAGRIYRIEPADDAARG